MSNHNKPRFILAFSSQEYKGENHAMLAYIDENLKVGKQHRIGSSGANETDAVESLLRSISRSAYDAEYIYKMSRVCEKWLKQRRETFATEILAKSDEDAQLAGERRECTNCGQTFTVGEATVYNDYGDAFASAYCYRQWQAREDKKKQPYQEAAQAKAGAELLSAATVSLGDKEKILVAGDFEYHDNEDYHYVKCEDCGSLVKAGLRVNADVKPTPDTVQWYEIEQNKLLIKRASVQTKHGTVEVSIGEPSQSPLADYKPTTEFRFTYQGHRYRVERDQIIMLQDTAVRWAHGFADAIVEGSVEVAEEY